MPATEQPQHQLWGPRLDCAHCAHPLECVEQSRRSGTWLGSFLCPYCRSEYFYAFQWGRLIDKSCLAPRAGAGER